MKLVFVYGTLKMGCRNHIQLAGQQYLGPARTAPGFRLFDLGDYPGMVAQADDRLGVVGEVWSVDDACLRRLDDFEGLSQGLYQRRPIPLLGPFADQVVEAYLYPHGVAGRTDLGQTWLELGPLTDVQ